MSDRKDVNRHTVQRSHEGRKRFVEQRHHSELAEHGGYGAHKHCQSQKIKHRVLQKHERRVEHGVDCVGKAHNAAESDKKARHKDKADKAFRADGLFQFFSAASVFYAARRLVFKDLRHGACCDSRIRGGYVVRIVLFSRFGRNIFRPLGRCRRCAVVLLHFSFLQVFKPQKE